MRRQKDKKTTQVILVAFIAFIMITSVIGFIWSGDGSVKYNGFSFELSQNFYKTIINDQIVYFSYLPQDVENIEIGSQLKSMLTNTPQIDLTSQVNDTNKETIALVAYDLNQVLNPISMIYLRQGFTDNNTFNMPIIKCEKTTVPVLYFKTSNQTQISLGDDCILIESKDASDFIRIKDRLLYSLLGVIQ